MGQQPLYESCMTMYENSPDSESSFIKSMIILLKRVFDTKENHMCKYLEFLFSIVIEYNTNHSIFKLVYLQISKRIISEG